MFKVFTKILKDQEISEEEEALISEFVMNRWLSGDTGMGLTVAQIFNIYPGIPLKAKILMIRELVSPRVNYIKYPKQTKKNDKHIEMISLYYGISYDLASDYYEAMPKEQIKEIKEYLEDTGGRKRN